MEQLKQQLRAEGIAYRENEPLAAHCTFKIGGPADVFAQPETEEQLCRTIALCRECGVKYYLLGNGSNILFEDAGYHGVVIDTTALKMGIGILENVCHPGAAPGEVYDAVAAGAGLKLSALCAAALENGLTGLEFAYGIPGTVGGAVYMNAGAYGGEMKQGVERVHFLEADGTPGVMSGEDLAFGYRKSAFMGTKRIITSAELRLESGAEADKTLKAGKFKAKLTLPEGRKTAAVIIAKYVNGTLGDLKMSEPKETQAIIETDFITVTGEDLTKQTEIKAFVFESTENIKPMYGFQHIIK